MKRNTNGFQLFLDQHDDTAWGEAVTGLLPFIHKVDQVATRIWFSFYPVALARTLENSSDPAKSAKELLLRGRYRLEDQIDTSAEFVYGHRYWSQVKRAVSDYAMRTPDSACLTLPERIREVACQTAASLKLDESLLVGITAIAFMTMQQVGYELFGQGAKSQATPSKWTVSADQVLKDRGGQDRLGVTRFFRSLNREFTVAFRENEKQGRFKLIKGQDLATAASKDKRDYLSQDPRCIEGPIPVECRSAACGTCWVGVLSGAEDLADPEPLEIRRMKDFGYLGFTGSKGSVIRLACQSKCFGNVSIVIPPWNGVIGKIPGIRILSS